MSSSTILEKATIISSSYVRPFGATKLVIKFPSTSSAPP